MNEYAPELTPHPLQRIGAFAIAALAQVARPEDMRENSFEDVRRTMVGHLTSTVNVDTSKDPGGFWLGRSYLFWPNSKMNPTNRKSQSPEKRRIEIEGWRRYPQATLDVPCTLCAKPSCGFYGKVDVPLGASVSHRNTTVPGHDGLALCRGCLASFHALPYGCEVIGGKAVTLHSWDDAFLRKTVGRQTSRTLKDAFGGRAEQASGPYSRERAALRALRCYEARITEPVDLYVFSNSNKEQSLDVYPLDQPLAEWLRATMRDPGKREGFRYLIRAHWTEKIPGTARLARNAFQHPFAVAERAFAYLVDLALEKDAYPAEAPTLIKLGLTYLTEVLYVNQRDIDRLKELGGRIAGVLAANPERGTLKLYEHLHRDAARLQSWLKTEAVKWTLTSDVREPFITDEQWRMLFDSDGRSRIHRDVLLVSVLQELAVQKKFANTDGDEDARAAREDDGLFNEEER